MKIKETVRKIFCEDFKFFWFTQKMKKVVVVLKISHSQSISMYITYISSFLGLTYNSNKCLV